MLHEASGMQCGYMTETSMQTTAEAVPVALFCDLAHAALLGSAIAAKAGKWTSELNTALTYCRCQGQKGTPGVASFHFATAHVYKSRTAPAQEVSCDYLDLDAKC